MLSSDPAPSFQHKKSWVWPVIDSRDSRHAKLFEVMRGFITNDVGPQRKMRESVRYYKRKHELVHEERACPRIRCLRS